MKVAFGSTIYKEGLQYAEEFSASINAQTYKDFDVLLINDNLTEVEGESICHKFYNPSFLIPSKGHTIFETRTFLLEEARRRGYELLVIGDFDDCFSEERIENIVKAVCPQYTFYYHDLRDFSGNLQFKTMPPTTEDVSMILEYNYLGMGNTAICVQQLQEDFLKTIYEGNTKVFDWYLYTRILAEGHKGKFVPQTNTYYRLHERNLAGSIAETKESIQKEIQVKLEHYGLLEKRMPELKDWIEGYKMLEERFQKGISISTTTMRKGYWWELLENPKKGEK